MYVPEDGVSVDTISQWGSDRPDVFLTNDYKGTIEKGYCAPLDDVLYDDPLFDAENIYVSSVAELMYNGNLYGVPHYCSVPLIFANKDFVGEDADFKCSISELDNLFEKVENEAPEGTVVFSKGYQLVPYITSANNAEVANSYMLKAEYKSNKSSSQSSLDRSSMSETFMTKVFSLIRMKMVQILSCHVIARCGSHRHPILHCGPTISRASFHLCRYLLSKIVTRRLPT